MPYNPINQATNLFLPCLDIGYILTLLFFHKDGFGIK